jgi:hypothetical protein
LQDTAGKAQCWRREGVENWMASANNSSITVDFVCKDCRDGRHGCPAIWEGYGLQIRCTCCSPPTESCVKRSEKDSNN